MCPEGQTLAQDGTTCINMGLVNVGKALYNNTAIQSGFYKATVRPAQPCTCSHVSQPLRPVAAVAAAETSSLGLLLVLVPTGAQALSTQIQLLHDSTSHVE